MRYPPARPAADKVADADATIPLAREELEVRKRKVDRSRVRVKTQVRERVQIVEQPLAHDEVEIERVPINRVIVTAAEPRYEDDVLVIPVMEEVAVVTKQILLKEEIRVRRRSGKRVHTERVVLRSEEASVEREDIEHKPVA